VNDWRIILRYIYLYIYLATASKGKQGGNWYERRGRKTGYPARRNLFYQGNVTEIYDAS